MRSILPIAEQLAERVQEAAASCGYEQKGILNSEILFLAACLHPKPPARIIESGRARGQSTALLARMFPKAEIISIELEQGTPDDMAATERLSGLANVKLLYGDSLATLPRVVRDDDVVLIDGPKGSLGIELCLRIGKSVMPYRTFLHDSHHGQLERAFTAAFWKGATYSDHPDFVEKFRYLDEPCWTKIEDVGDRAWQAPYTRNGESQQSYGPTLSCLPPLKKRDASWLLRELKRMQRHFAYWRR